MTRATSRAGAEGAMSVIRAPRGRRLPREAACGLRVRHPCSRSIMCELHGPCRTRPTLAGAPTPQIIPLRTAGVPAMQRGAV